MTHLNIQMSQASKDTGKQVLRALGALLFVIAIVWVGMQSFRVLPGVRQSFANAFVSVQSFFSPAERIVVSVVDSQVVVDEPFSVTWEHRGKESDGSYTMIYECRDAVHLARVSPQGESTLFCNTEVPILGSDSSLSLVARGEVDGIVQIPLSIRFTRNNTSVIGEEGTVEIVVQGERFDTGIATSTDNGADDDETPASTTTRPTTPPATRTPNPVAPRPGTPTFTTIPIVTQPTSDPNGEADLSIRVLGTGLADSDCRDFDERNEIPQDLPSGKRGAIQFEIENDGTKKTGDDWNFSVKLPTSPSETFTSPSQPDLFPNDKVTYTICFNRVVNRDEAEYTITVDPRDEVDESNERNNSITREIDIDRD
ncbi:MAG TPA: CARDB domain-containing protein [Candidatus Paceibacterota bacterium]|nr:CARDB domain-containing protein [Candidatus Paceibacterota bacterium]